MSISLAKHDGILKVDMDLPARGLMVPATLTVTRAGIEVRPRGRRFAASAPWWKVLKSLALPPSAPAKFCLNVEGFLAERPRFESRKRRTP
jgi:hypothetical protein